MNNADIGGSTKINPAASAETINSTQLPHVDYLVTGQNAERRIPADARFREEARAVNLGHAAGHAVVSEALAQDILPPLAEHYGTEARLEASEHRRHISEQLHVAAANVAAALREVPLNDVDPIRRLSVNVGKLLLIIGDTCVLANQVYRASTPIWLAIPLGLSLATSVVAIGSKCGHEIATTQQRRDRGPAPEYAASVVRPLYDNGTAEERHLLWQRLSYLAAGVMFLALYFIGSGSGDPVELAAGYGLLAALTVAGSAGAEAYAANDAAEQREQAERRLARMGNELREFEDLEKLSAQRYGEAATLEVAAHHRGVATATTVTATANRLPDSPEVGGYIDGEHIPVTAAPPSPRAQSVLPVPRRTRTRQTYELADDPIATEVKTTARLTGSDAPSGEPPPRRTAIRRGDPDYEIPSNVSSNVSSNGHRGRR